MQITVKPFTSEYTGQCAELEKYLWKEDQNGRVERFDWEYINCPNSDSPLCVIAVDENDEVVGFRGFFLNIFIVNGRTQVVAQICDTVVSAKTRRMGVFQKMTEFSLQFLKEKGISMVLDLGPSWPPYFGYKKMGFEDLSQFHSKYRFCLCQMFSEYVLKKNRMSWAKKGDHCVSKNAIKYCLSQSVDDSLLKQVDSLDTSSAIHASLTFSNLKWRTLRPGQHYIYAYVVDERQVLHSFVMMKTKNYFNYEIGVMVSDNNSELQHLMKLFRKEYKPAAMAVWNFALDEATQRWIKLLGMHSIPFINKIRKNPPALLRTLQTKDDGTLDWIVNGKDIRDVSNWHINKLDLDSF